MSTLGFTESELLIDPKELVSRLGKRSNDFGNHCRDVLRTVSVPWRSIRRLRRLRGK